MASSSRRDFLKVGVAGAAAGLAAACTSAAPVRTRASPVSEPAAGQSALSMVSTALRTLVVVQLSGGNDGLNAVVPYGNGLDYQLRPQIGIPTHISITLND